MPKFDPKSIKLDGIHVMKNSDKTWHESWNKPRTRSLAAFPHPFTLCLLGIKNRGKTNTIVNVFLQHQTTCDPFKELIVIGPSNGSAEYAEMEPTYQLTDIPTLESFSDKKIKKLLVFDDFDLSKLNATQKKNLSQLVRCNTHVGVSNNPNNPNSDLRTCEKVGELWSTGLLVLTLKFANHSSHQG
jgi:hypothetical protein